MKQPPENKIKLPAENKGTGQKTQTKPKGETKSNEKEKDDK